MRTCKATGSDLILIPPLGFKTTDRHLKRAGLDYWDGVNVNQHSSLEDLLRTNPDFYLFSSKASTSYKTVSYTPNTHLVFGSETSGLPPHILETYPERLVTIPMLPTARCLNLSNAVAIALYK